MQHKNRELRRSDLDKVCAVELVAPRGSTSRSDSIRSALEAIPDISVRTDAADHLIVVSRGRLRAWIGLELTAGHGDMERLAVVAGPFARHFPLVEEICRVLEHAGFRLDDDFLAESRAVLGA